jgi:hypothetical protein
MPPVIIGLTLALAAGEIGAGLAAIGVAIGTAVAIGNALIGIGLSMTISGFASMLTKHPSATQAQTTINLGSSSVSVRQALAPRVTQYGQDRRGGIITFLDLTGATGQNLQMVITLSGHQLQSIDNMYFDGTLVPLDGTGGATGKYSGFVHVEKKLGGPGEAAFAGLIAADPTKWTANHRQDGCGSVYIQLKWSATLFPTGIPNITFDIHGKQVFDPRTGLTAYSEDVALCVSDYLTATKPNANALTACLGLGDDPANIDTNTLISSANTCDETVLKADSTTEARYTCNGSFSSDQLPRDIIPALLSAMGGTAVYAEGVWKIYSAAYRPSNLPAFTDNDLRDSIRYQPLISRRDLANSVKGTYRGPLTSWQPDDFPPVVNAAAVTQDGESIWLDLQLPFTMSPSMAQRISKIQLLRIRNQGTCTFPGKLTAYQAEVCDVVQVTRSRFGWNAKNFEVTDSQLKILADANNNPIIGCDLALRETDSSIYAWNAATEETPVVASIVNTLPDPSTVAPCSTLAISESPVGVPAVGGASVLRVLVAFTPPADQYVLDGGHIWIERRDHGDMVWRFAGKVAGAETQFFDYNIFTGHTYDYRVKAEGAIGGAFSPYLEVDNLTINGNQIILMSAAHAQQGSIRPSAMPAFTIATNSNNGSGACTIRITAPATSLPLTDGTSISMPAVDTTWSGVLAASTTYLFVPRLKLADLTVHFTTGTGVNVDADQPTVPLTSTATQAQKNQLSVNQYFDGYVPLSDGYISVTTPSNAGTGGGSSGGDPGCIHEDEVVCIAGVLVRAAEAEVGDLIKGENLATGELVFRRIVGKVRTYCSDWYRVQGRLITPGHPVWVEDAHASETNSLRLISNRMNKLPFYQIRKGEKSRGKWIPAFQVPAAEHVTGQPGYKVSLSVDDDSFDQQNFIVYGTDGSKLIVHNSVLPRS